MIHIHIAIFKKFYYKIYTRSLFRMDGSRKRKYKSGAQKRDESNKKMLRETVKSTVPITHFFSIQQDSSEEPHHSQENQDSTVGVDPQTEMKELKKLII